MCLLKLVFLTSLLLTFSGAARAEVCKVSALLGEAAISEGDTYTEVKAGDVLEISNTLETFPWSKAKLIFVDGSLLTLDEKSTLKIDDHFYNSAEDTAATLTLKAGSMRLDAGVAEFEINSDVALITARNAVLETGIGFEEGNFFMTLICHWGAAEVQSSDPSVEGTVTVRQGQIVTIWKGEALLPAIPLPSSESMVSVIKPIKETIADTSASTRETMEDIRNITAFLRQGTTDTESIRQANGLPPFNQQPLFSAPVTVNLSFQD